MTGLRLFNLRMRAIFVFEAEGEPLRGDSGACDN